VGQRQQCRPCQRLDRPRRRRHLRADCVSSVNSPNAAWDLEQVITRYAAAMAARLRDADPKVRRRAVVALREVECGVVPTLPWGLENLTSVRGRIDVVELLKGRGNPASVAVLKLL